MRNPFSGFARARDKPSLLNVMTQVIAFYFGGSLAGKTVTPRTAMQTTTVYACVRVISETIASLPLNVFERQPNGGAVKAWDHPLYTILHDEPNGEMTSFAWRETMMAHLLLWGNSYSQLIRNGRGQVIGIYPLVPEKMHVDRDSATKLITYTYNLDGAEIPMRPEDVLHIPGLGFDGIMGYSPIAMERNAIGLSIATEEYGSKFFANGATPGGVLTHPGTVKNPKALRDSWNESYGGSANAGKAAVLEEGMKFEKISLANDEAQFLESRKFQVNELCRIFRVPPHMIGDLEHATFSNIEHQAISFAMHTIRPWLSRIEQSFQRGLIPDSEKQKYFCAFNLDGLMRGDYKSRMDGYAVARQNGWMSANDIRELENQNPIPAVEGGDTYLVNGNMISLATAANGGGMNAPKDQP